LLNISKKIYSPIIETYLSYEDILLKDFYSIADSGDFSKLQLTGKPNENGCAVAWEEIIKQNGEETNSRHYEKYLDNYRKYNKTANEYQLIKAQLISLMMVFDKGITDELNVKGYRIFNQPTGNRTQDTANYTESILNAGKRVENLKSKCNSLAFEMNKYTESLTNKKQAFSKVIGALIYEIPGLNNPEEIKLATYNELVSRLRKHNSQSVNTKHNG
jgi:hypothetical protein